MGSLDAPVDTTDDIELEARWQALVQAVIDAKRDADEARGAVGSAAAAVAKARTPDGDVPLELVNAELASRVAYRAAVAAVAAAQERMKAGDL